MQATRSFSLFLIIALIGFPQISETIYTPSLPSIEQGLQTTAYAVESTLTLYFIGFAIGVALWGAISDYIGRRKAMLAGLLLYSLSSLACSYAYHVEELIIWRLVQAFGASVGSVITQTMLRDLYEGPKRAQLFSVIAGALAFSPALGPLIGGYLAEWWDWRANFTALTLTGVALLAWSWKALPETKSADIVRPSKKQLKELAYLMASSKAFWGHTLLIGATNGILFSFYGEAPFLFTQLFGLSTSQYGRLGLLIASATIVASKLSYHLNKKWKGEGIIQAGALLAFLGASLWMGLLQLQMEWEMLNWIAMLACLWTLFLGVGLIIPNSLSVAMKPYQALVGTAGSLFGGCYYLFIAGCLWLTSLFHDGTSLPLASILTTLSGCLVLGSFLIRECLTRTAKANVNLL